MPQLLSFELLLSLKYSFKAKSIVSELMQKEKKMWLHGMQCM